MNSGRVWPALFAASFVALRDTVIYRQTPGPVELELSLPCSFLADGDLWVTDKRFRLEVLPLRLEVVTG